MTQPTLQTISTEPPAWLTQQWLWRQKTFTCSICITEKKIPTQSSHTACTVLEQCKHIFCTDCIVPILLSTANRTCPNCRVLINSYQVWWGITRGGKRQRGRMQHTRHELSKRVYTEQPCRIHGIPVFPVGSIVTTTTNPLMWMDQAMQPSSRRIPPTTTQHIYLPDGRTIIRILRGDEEGLASEIQSPAETMGEMSAASNTINDESQQEGDATDDDMPDLDDDEFDGAGVSAREWQQQLQHRPRPAADAGVPTMQDIYEIYERRARVVSETANLDQEIAARNIIMAGALGESGDDNIITHGSESDDDDDHSDDIHADWGRQHEAMATDVIMNTIAEQETSSSINESIERDFETLSLMHRARTFTDRYLSPVMIADLYRIREESDREMSYLSRMTNEQKNK